MLILTNFFPLTRGQPVGPLARAAMAGGFQQVVLAVLAVFIAPVIEEFLFRGALLAGFEQSMGRPRAVVLVTTAFVLLHLPEVRHYAPAMIAITGLALLLMGVRLKTGSIGPSIVLHSCYNLGLVLTFVTMSPPLMTMSPHS